MEIKNVRAIILAAGRSSRFNTEKSKLIFTVCGQPMVTLPIRVLKNLNIPTTLVLGYQADAIKEEIAKANLEKISYVVQKEQLGTGDAIACANKTWDKDNILVLNGDMPLITENLIEDFIKEHLNTKSVISFMAAHVVNPFSYGRIIKTKNKVEIVEEKNCTEKQKNITLINAGVYLIKKDFLEKNITKLKKNAVSKEYYITDLVQLASKQNKKVNVMQVSYDCIRGVNTLEELWAVEQVKRSELMKSWMRKGVRFELAQSIHLDIDVEIGSGSFIGTGAHILTGTKIGKNCVINAFTIIENSIIHDNVQIRSHSVIQDSAIGCNSVIGPFARLRGNVVIGENSQLGNFVEVKNSKIGNKTKAKHLSYIGDSQIGNNVTIGAGTITCNYDGINKNKTIIEDNAFVGSNNSLVAPIKIGKHSYTAAGSTITKDVPEESLAIGRARQENKENYKNNKQEENKKNKLDFIGAIKARDIKEHSL